MNIAVVGLGVMGLCCAIKLARKGFDKVTLFDDPTRKPASRCAGGMLAPYSESDTLDPHAQKLAFQYSLPFWRELSESLGFLFKDNGTLVMANPQDQALLKRFLTHLPEHSYEKMRLEDLIKNERHINPRFAEAYWIPDEAYIETAQALTRMRQFVQKRFVSCDERVNFADLPDRGFDTIIDCRGAFVQEPRLRAVKGERILVRCQELELKHCIRLMHPRYPFYVVPQGNHHYVVGASMIEDNMDESVTTRSVLELLTGFASLTSLALESEIISMDAGLRPAYPDNKPKVKFKNENHLHILHCNGLYRHGFLMAPLMSEIIISYLENQSIPKEFDKYVSKDEHDEIIH